MPIRAIPLAALLISLSARAEPGEMALGEALRLAEINSPRLSASRFREAAAQSAVGIARSGYLPTLEWDEMDSSRFPESGRTLGVGGLIGSPYRSGRVSAAVAKATLWDFGRTSNGVEAARRGVDVSREDTRLARLDVLRAALVAYYDCARLRAQAETWEGIGNELKLVAKEVNRFVQTGQTSVVARYLVDFQIEETETHSADFEARLKIATDRLALLTGMPAEQVKCPSLPQEDSAALGPGRGEPSPIVSQAAAEAAEAHARVAQAKADYYPKVLAAGTAGSLDAAGTPSKGAYAFAAGVSLPLFEGMRTTEEVRRAEALAQEKERRLDEARLRLAEINSRYDEDLASTRVRLEHLSRELASAQLGFNLAKKRYLSLQGDVVDLREALRNLAQARTQINDTRTEALQTSGVKVLVNGAY